MGAALTPTGGHTAGGPATGPSRKQAYGKRLSSSEYRPLAGATQEARADKAAILRRACGGSCLGVTGWWRGRRHRLCLCCRGRAGRGPARCASSSWLKPDLSLYRRSSTPKLPSAEPWSSVKRGLRSSVRPRLAESQLGPRLNGLDETTERCRSEYRKLCRSKFLAGPRRVEQATQCQAVQQT
jgi:hypothetical protein